MKHPESRSLVAATAAILALAQVKSATEAFDQGESNAFEALGAIEAALDAYREATPFHRGAA